MNDYIIRAITSNKSIRAFVAVTTNLVEKARNIHNTSPVATAALGRVLTTAAIMGAMLRGDKDSLTIQIKGNGELGGIVAVSDSKSNVRGYVHNPDVDIPLKSNGKLDVSGAIGEGYLNITKDIGLKEPYTGQVPLVSGEIAEDFAYYFLTSEQTNSGVGMGVLIERDYKVDAAGGFIIQTLPDIDQESLQILEKNLSQVTSVTDLIKKYNSQEEILKYILHGLEVEILDKIPTQYLCTCSNERIERALISMGKNELEDLIKDQGEAQISCHFCDKKYYFSKKDLELLLNDSLKE